MSKPEKSRSERTPAYHRWKDPRSSFLVELKVDLVQRMIAELQAAEAMGQEAGGVLIGSFPRSVGSPILRIEDFETVGRRSGDSRSYSLLAEQRARFTAVRKRVTTPEVSAVGFFRSHLREGAFELTLADRDLLSAEFKNSIHVALLIGNDHRSDSALEPQADTRRYVATYFVSVNGTVQNRVNPLTLPFDAAELEGQMVTAAQLKTDVPPVPDPADTAQADGAEQPTVTPESEPIPKPPKAKRIGRAAWLGVAVVTILSLLFVVWVWQRQGGSVTGGLLPGFEQPLSVTVSKELVSANHRQVLEIGWNHVSQSLLHATRVQLTVTNPVTHQTIYEMDVQPSDLALGRLRLEVDEQPAEVSVKASLADGQEVSALAQVSTGAATN